MLAAGALLTAGACGGDDGSELSPGGDSDPTETTEPGASETTDSAEKGTVAMSGQDFTEMQIMAEMYRQVLEGAGYTVDVNLVGTRDLYIKGLGNGQIDLCRNTLQVSPISSTATNRSRPTIRRRRSRQSSHWRQTQASRCSSRPRRRTRTRSS